MLKKVKRKKEKKKGDLYNADQKRMALKWASLPVSGDFTVSMYRQLHWWKSDE